MTTYATLGYWAKRLTAVEVSLLCVALNRYTDAGVEATRQTLPFFTRTAARDALIAAEPHLVERGQVIVQRLLQQLVSMEETSGENARHN